MGYKSEKLWILLEKKAVESDNDKPEDKKIAPEFITGVDKVCVYAINRAKAIRDTFPAYTLHDEIHICNVLRLMENLLGSRINDLTRDETSMLILSACCHDIGMSYNEDDKNEVLSNRERLDKYLETHPAEYVKAYENSTDEPLLSNAMLQNYFRCIHHERVQDLLYDIEWPTILNGSVDREDLITICQSHGDDASKLARMTATPTIDLRMCAILLRLADILDFDTTRVPRSLYDYEKIATTTNSITYNEWEKHYSSNGFHFSVPGRHQPYPLPFSANCKNMQIEHIVQTFLNWIDSELDECGKLLSRHTGRWNDLILPEKIERRIIAEGYVSGEYHLTLDHDQVLDLLAGRDLYGDPSVFVRELLQNAIDSVRTRRELDKNLPKNWKPQVNIRTWTDSEGYQWFRIEDNGIGMTEDTIRNYFLKIGCSYYNSSEFKKDKIRYNANPDYMPISRFGIGILSCFIGGDQIEVSTKRFKDDKDGYPGYRLKMQGMNGYFYLADSSKGHRPGPMKGVLPDECHPYRNEAGTIIAVRTNLYKGGTYSGFREIVSKYLLYPPIPVHYAGPDGEFDFICEHDFIEAIHNLPGSSNGQFEFELTSAQMKVLNNEMPGIEWEEYPKAIVHCAVFDSFLPSKYLNGAVVSAWASGCAKNSVSLNIGNETISLQVKVGLNFSIKKKELALTFGYDITDELEREKEYLKSKMNRFDQYNLDFDEIECEDIDDLYWVNFSDVQWKSYMKSKYNLSPEELDVLQKEMKYKYGDKEKLNALEKISKPYSFVVHDFADNCWLFKFFSMAIANRVMVHNGIIVDMKEMSGYFRRNTYNLASIILLKDKFRPNVDISRNGIKSLNVATAISLALLRQQMINKNIYLHSAIIENYNEQFRFFPLSRWIAEWDGMESVGNYLRIEKDKDRSLSFEELVSVVQSDNTIIFSLVKNSFWKYSLLSSDSVLRYLSTALLQRHFKCTYIDGEKIQIELISNNEIQHIENFPAMFFMEFSGKHQSKFLSRLVSKRFFCNINHVVSRWIIINQDELRERVPGILFELIRNIIEVSTPEVITNIRELLDKIRALPGNPIPVPDDIYLSEDDFY